MNQGRRSCVRIYEQDSRKEESGERSDFGQVQFSIFHFESLLVVMEKIIRHFSKIIHIIYEDDKFWGKIGFLKKKAEKFLFKRWNVQ